MHRPTPDPSASITAMSSLMRSSLMGEPRVRSRERISSKDTAPDPSASKRSKDARSSAWCADSVTII